MSVEEQLSARGFPVTNAVDWLRTVNKRRTAVGLSRLNIEQAKAYLLRSREQLLRDIERVERESGEAT